MHQLCWPVPLLCLRAEMEVKTGIFTNKFDVRKMFCTQESVHPFNLINLVIEKHELWPKHTLLREIKMLH